MLASGAFFSAPKAAVSIDKLTRLPLLVVAMLKMIRQHLNSPIPRKASIASIESTRRRESVRGCLLLLVVFHPEFSRDYEKLATLLQTGNTVGSMYWALFRFLFA